MTRRWENTGKRKGQKEKYDKKRGKYRKEKKTELEIWQEERKISE